MTSLEEIELAAGNLSPIDFASFRNWIFERDSLAWDNQMEHDGVSDKLDFLIEQAMRSKDGDDLRSLDDIHNNG